MADSRRCSSIVTNVRRILQSLCLSGAALLLSAVLAGANYSTPFAHAYRAHKRLGVPHKQIKDIQGVQITLNGVANVAGADEDREVGLGFLLERIILIQAD